MLIFAFYFVNKTVGLFLPWMGGHIDLKGKKKSPYYTRKLRHILTINKGHNLVSKFITKKQTVKHKGFKHVL